MAITFKYKQQGSSIFGSIDRPIAQVEFQHQKDKSFQPVTMLVDTGADYTLLPKFLSSSLGISLSQDCRKVTTYGVGGKSEVYLLKGKIKVKLGEFERNIPIGFLSNNDIPPLLGREEFFETFKVTFVKKTVTFDD